MISARMCAVMLTALLLPACATVTRGTHEQFKIVSAPPGADVKLSTGETCTTPCEVKLKRKSDFTVEVSKAGFSSESVHVYGKMRGSGGAAMAGNILAGGLIGGIVDGSNGATLSLTPNPVDVTLKPIVAAAPIVTAAPHEAAAPPAVIYAPPAPPAAAELPKPVK